MFSDDDHEFDEPETAPDVEASLPAENLHIIVSRVKENDGEYTTEIWANRKVRRFYAMGLLQEAMAILQSNPVEIIYFDDGENIIDDNDDNLGSGVPAPT